jgi:hypothetical protein
MFLSEKGLCPETLFSSNAGAPSYRFKANGQKIRRLHSRRQARYLGHRT